MHVSAILLVRGGPERVATVVTGLACQTRRPDRLIAVDALQDPDTTELLRSGLGPDAHLTWVRPGSSTAVAVRAALELPDDDAHAPDDGWLWILTDEASPAPDTLERLLAEAETSPSVAVAGCAEVSWDDDQQLLSVGTTVTGLGARIRGVDLREVSQGQYDDRSDVYAVPLAGMLVRRSAYDAVDGFDPALRLARDDLDFCRRIHLAGHRVVVVPRAIVARDVPGPHEVARRDRHDALHLRLAQAPWWLILPALLWSLAAIPARALWRLVLKQPGPAVDEALGALSAVFSPLDVIRARRRHRRGKRVPRRVLKALRPTMRQIRWQRRDDLTAYRFWDGAFDDSEDVLRLPTRREPGLPLTSLTDAEAEADVGLVPVLVRRRPPLLAGAAAVLLALVAAVVAWRDVIPDAGSALAGPALLPAPEHLTRLWNDAVTSWRPVGLGRAAAADPFDQVLALLSLPVGGSPRLAVLAVCLLAVPLSAWTAWYASGALTRSRLLRPWAALVWSASPVLLLALREGRLGELLAHTLLPLLALALARAVGVPRWRAPLQIPSTGVSTSLLAAAVARDAAARRPRASLAAASAAGLLTVLLIACAPWAAAPLVVLIGVTALVGPQALRMPRPARRRSRATLGWTLAVAVVGAAPWWWQVARQPRLLLADASSTSAAQAPQADLDPGPGWRDLADVVVGRAAHLGDLLGGDEGAPARQLARVLPRQWQAHVGDILVGIGLAVVVPALLASLAALVAAGRRRSVASLGALLALMGGVVALASTRVVTGRAAATPASGWGGAGLTLVTAGMLAAALVGADALRRRTRRVGSRVLRGAVAGLAAGTLLVGPCLMLAGWAWARPQVGGVQPVDADVMTVVGKAEAEGPAATRTLVLRVGDSVDWSLLRDAGPAIGQRSAAWALSGGSRRDVEVIAPLLGSLLSDSGADVRPALARLAIGTIMLRTPIDPAAQASLDSSPGLVRTATDDDAVLTWRVDLDSAGGSTRPSRAWLDDGTATTPVTDTGDPQRLTATIATGTGLRTLVLAERADPRWRATLDGHVLPRATADGWAQAFEVPADGGRLVVWHRDLAAMDLQRLSWVALALAALVAIPVPRRRRPPAPPRPSRPVERSEGDDLAPRTRVSGVAEEEALQRWATGSWDVIGDAGDVGADGELGDGTDGTDGTEREPSTSTPPAGVDVRVSEPAQERTS